jgi:hypothetical protein
LRSKRDAEAALKMRPYGSILAAEAPLLLSKFFSTLKVLRRPAIKSMASSGSNFARV